MAWPIDGENGWEAFGTPITSTPQVRELPEPRVTWYYDPVRLGGAGPAIPARTHLFHGQTIIVRARSTALEAQFVAPYMWSDGLLDQFAFERSEPCALVLDIYDDDRETILWSVGTSPYHEHPYLLMPDSYGEQEVDVAAGAASIGTVSVGIIDPARLAGDQDSGWLTMRLAAATAANIRGRRARLRRFISEALGWQTIADGPAGTPTLDESYAAYTIPIRDTRETERKVRIFDGGGGMASPVAGGSFDPTGVKTLLPDAVWGGYGYDAETDTYLVDPATPITGTANLGNPEVPFDYMFTVSVSGAPLALRTITNAAWRAMDASSVEVLGVETFWDAVETHYRLRFRDLTLFWRGAGSGDPWTQLGSGTLILDGIRREEFSGSAGYQLANLVHSGPDGGGNNRVVSSIMFGDTRGAAFLPTDGQAIELVVVYRGPPTKDLPVYIEGITAGQLATNVYAGLYSRRATDGAVVPTGIRYDAAALAAMTDLVRFRLTEVVTDARDWLEKMIYAPTGWAPALDRFGAISPVSQVAPLDLTGLTTLHNGITEPAPNWNAGERIVNVLRFTYPREYRPTDPAQATTGDGLTTREIVVEWEDPISVERDGRQVLEIDGTAFAAIGTASAEPVLTTREDEAGFRLSQLRQLHVQNRYALGAPTISVAVMRTAIPTHRAGDWVLLDLTWLPDYVTARRGLVALAQIVALGDLDCAWRQVLVEVVVPLAPVS